MKLQQVEWFAARKREIALAQRAADRRRMIAELGATGHPLAADFAKANARAEAAARVARNCGDYPLLSGGDTNINSLFVERAARLCKADGVVGLLVPSGISTETASQEFFSKLIENGTAKCVYDFFNKRANGELFFPDVYYRFKFSAFVFSPATRNFGACRFATFVRDVAELADESRTYTLGLADFAKVNPNTRTAPVYRDIRDKELSTKIYDCTPILVRRSTQGNDQTWPVRYTTMFHMANDSGVFRTRRELEEREGAYPIGGNLWRNPAGTWVPLYEGKMVQAFDHRAASITTVAKNVHRPGQSAVTTLEEHQEPDFLPDARYYVLAPGELKPEIALKDITSTTNSRSIIACIIPPYAAGHPLPLIQMQIADAKARAQAQALLCANLNSVVLDFVARTKILSNHASWFIIEQLPVIAPPAYHATLFGKKTADAIIREAVLELTYTAHDMAPYARDMGHVDRSGKVKPPFPWDEERRFHLRAKLDALYFCLYGVTDRDDVRYIYSTFPIVEREEQDAYGAHRSRELCLAYMNALAAGDPDAELSG